MKWVAVFSKNQAICGRLTEAVSPTLNNSINLRLICVFTRFNLTCFLKAEVLFCRLLVSLAVYLCVSSFLSSCFILTFCSSLSVSQSLQIRGRDFRPLSLHLSLCSLHLNPCSSPPSSVPDVCVWLRLTRSKSGCVTQKTIHKAYFISRLYDVYHLVLRLWIGRLTRCWYSSWIKTLLFSLVWQLQETNSVLYRENVQRLWEICC